MFDSDSELANFSKGFSKSLSYCDSRNLRTIQLDSLDYKVLSLSLSLSLSLFLSFSLFVIPLQFFTNILTFIQMKRLYTNQGTRKYKGTSYPNSFFGSELIDWICQTESIDKEKERERAIEIASHLVVDGVVKPAKLKKMTHTPFLDKHFPYQFVWSDLEGRLQILREIGKSPSPKLIIHCVGLKGSKEFRRATKFLGKLKGETDVTATDRIVYWNFSFDDELKYKDWMYEKRLALDAKTPSAKYHEASHLIWISFETTEHYIGEYAEMVELFSEAHLLIGPTLKKAQKSLKSKSVSN